jgi:hypothetical protein
MKIICKWFHEDERIIGDVPGEGVSHGICPECKARLLREAEEMILKYRRRNREMKHDPGRLQPDQRPSLLVHHDQ